MNSKSSASLFNSNWTLQTKKHLLANRCIEFSKPFATFMAKVKSDQLPNDALLCVAPVIYQAFFAKKGKLRVQFFGHTLMAVKVDAK